MLSERQEKLLGIVVRHYVETGSAAGSKMLVAMFDLGISPATVRNEFVMLTEMGYLMQMHTSAGRVPTEQGYRYFVQKLLGDFNLPLHERQMIRHQFHQARLDIDQWMRLAAAILARTSLGASFVTAPRPLSNRFKHLQLISTQGRLVLMILVLYGGDVKQQMLTLAEPVSQAQLSDAVDHLNRIFGDMTAEEIRLRMGKLEVLEHDVALLVLDILDRADNRAISNIYRDGLVNIVEDEGTRQAVRVLEERTLLANVLSETQTAESGVQVVIGGEGRWEELKECSIILSRYGIAEEFSGTVAVIGPTRMSYGRNVAAVRYVAGLMSGFLYEYLLESSLSKEDKTNEVKIGE
ncbi:MAG: heat-inducible transcription repressor HrcA [Chloroflexi bacterium]|nr:heat-inducible transcription repressor HrcA [Chloroflexota bacterium]